MSNEMKQKAMKAVPNRWFVFCILTLSGGIAFKLSSMKDMFYVPMQQFMGHPDRRRFKRLWNCADHWPDFWYLYLRYVQQKIYDRWLPDRSWCRWRLPFHFPWILGIPDRIRRYGYFRRSNLLASSFKSNPAAGR